MQNEKEMKRNEAKKFKRHKTKVVKRKKQSKNKQKNILSKIKERQPLFIFGLKRNKKYGSKMKRKEKYRSKKK
jgi:uncharacterized protein (DUF2225 family)